MKSSKTRKKFNCSNAKLRRARRLYGYLVHKEIFRNPDIVFICAQRAKEAGLYSEKTRTKSIIFSLVRKTYVNLYKGNPKDTFGWHAWMKANKKLEYIWYKELPSRNGKPVLRLIA